MITMKNFQFLVQYSTCIWDKDTDEMIWWPSEVYACEGNHNFSLPDPVYKNGFALTMTSEFI